MSNVTYLQIPIASTLEPHEVLLRYRNDQHPFALIGTWLNSQAIIGSMPTLVHDFVTNHDSSSRFSFELLNLAADGETPLNKVLPSQAAAPDGIFGGWVGYIGYPESVTAHPNPTIPSWFGWYDHILRFSSSHGWFFEALSTPDRAHSINKRLQQAKSRLGHPPPSNEYHAFSFSPFSTAPSPSQHQRNVEEALTRIKTGQLEHLNLTMRFEASLKGGLLDAFVQAAAVLKAPYTAFLAPGPSHQLASFSPEQFVARRQNTVTTKPIKGTRARVGEPVKDELSAQSLLHSGKERHENRLVVDLAVAELNRICVPDTVKITELFRLEAHPGLWHMVSEITGEVPDQLGDGSLLEACFPPASITGTPKEAAVALIAELETKPRHVYTGTIGMISVNAKAEWGVAIRTFEARDGQTSLGVGGGLTEASNSAEETQECLIKARPLIEALGGTVATQNWPQP